MDCGQVLLKVYQLNWRSVLQELCSDGHKVTKSIAPASFMTRNLTYEIVALRACSGNEQNLCIWLIRSVCFSLAFQRSQLCSELNALRAINFVSEVALVTHWKANSVDVKNLIWKIFYFQWWFCKVRNHQETCSEGEAMVFLSTYHILKVPFRAELNDLLAQLPNATGSDSGSKNWDKQNSSLIEDKYCVHWARKIPMNWKQE